MASSGLLSVSVCLSLSLFLRNLNLKTSLDLVKSNSAESFDLVIGETPAGLICFLFSKTWRVKMREYPGVEILFFLGRDQDQDTHVSHLININVKRGRNFFGYKIKQINNNMFGRITC